MAKSREWTVKCLEAMDGGLLSPRTVAEMCLNWLSEDDVEEMCSRNDLFQEGDE